MSLLSVGSNYHEVAWISYVRETRLLPDLSSGASNELFVDGVSLEGHVLNATSDDQRSRYSSALTT